MRGFCHGWWKMAPIEAGGPLVANSLRSMPAQKFLPLAVRTPAVSSPSASSCSRAALRASASSALSALRWSGRFRVMTRTRPRRSVSRTSDTWGAPSGGRQQTLPTYAPLHEAGEVLDRALQPGPQVHPRLPAEQLPRLGDVGLALDRKSTRLKSSH